MKRYNRQKGLVDQKKLKNLKVAVCGLGGLGSLVAYEVCGLGVGDVLLVDNDKVSITDLNRQFLYTENDIGKQKVEVSWKRLKKFNSEITIKKKNSDVSDIDFSDRDIVFSCLDNWRSRFVLDEKSHKEDFVLIHGSAREFKGIVYTHYDAKNPCLKKVFKIRKTTEKTRITCHICTAISSIMVSEMLKFLEGENVFERMLLIDLKKMRIEGVKI